MKRVNIFLLIFGFCFSQWIEPCIYHEDPESKKYHYFKGEILLPDYAHTDTLTVIDALGLNSAMETLEPATDQEISDILHTYCK